MEVGGGFCDNSVAEGLREKGDGMEGKGDGGGGINRGEIEIGVLGETLFELGKAKTTSLNPHHHNLRITENIKLDQSVEHLFFVAISCCDFYLDHDL